MTIRQAVQAMLDAHGDGWQCAELVVCMALERVDASGELESGPWIWTPHDQPEWKTDGLLEAAVELRHDSGD